MNDQGPTPEASSEPKVASPSHVTPVPELTPVVAAAAIPVGPARTRWLTAGLVSVLVIAGAVAAALILGAKPLPEAFRYLREDSVIVAEIRPDLPGDQRQHLGNFLAHFPGFADQSNLSEKIDETLDRLVDSASSGSVDYTTRVKPLISGPIVVGAGVDGLRNRAALLVATTDGVVTCGVVFGSATPLETHRGVALESVDGDMACARDGRFMLVGDPGSIRAGIDAHLDNKGVDRNSRFTAARQRLAGDQVAIAYVDGAALTTMAETFAYSLSPGSGLGSMIAGRIADWMVIGMRVVDDAVQVEVQAAPITEDVLPSSVPTDPLPATSRFASMLPSTTFGFIEVHGVGANLQRALAIVKSDPSQSAAVSQIEQALAAVGGVQNVAAWIEDAGIAVVPAGDDVGGAVLLRGSDAAAVESRVTQLRNLLVLASTGTDITVHDTDHAGIKITNVDLGDLSTLVPGLGFNTRPGVDARLSLSIAVRDDILILAVGDGVIESVLDTATGSSLKSTGAYAHVAELVGSPNDVEVFVAIDGLLGYLKSNLPAGLDDASWVEFKPYLDHLAAFGEANVTTGSGGRSRLVITVK